MASDSDAESLNYEEEVFEVLGCELAVLTVGELPLTLLATLSQNDSEISGRRVWAGSLFLAHFLGSERRAALEAAPRVLELGCGSGVAGLALAKAAGVHVDLTDGDPEAVELLRDNVVRNDLADRAQVAELFWGNEASLQAFIEERGKAGAREAYPVIMAGDVLYKEALIAPLLATVRRFLGPRGTFYLCHIPRFNVYHSVVAAALAGDAWNVREVLEPEDVLKRHPLPESWDEDVLSDVQRAKIFVVQAEDAVDAATMDEGTGKKKKAAA